jgi:hypothetical protein
LTKVVRHDDEIYELGWQRRKGIEAYASTTSVVAGDTLSVHVSTYPANKYSVSIYRMGYYGGAGARLMRTMGPLQGTTEPTPNDGNRSVIECTWKVGIQSRDPEGLAERRVSRQALDASVTVRTVSRSRDDQRKLRRLHRSRQSEGGLLFQASDMTWLSYNRWPQWRSMYDLGDEHWGASNSKVGYDVSFDRPLRALLERIPGGISSADQRIW